MTKQLEIRGAYSHYDQDADILYIHIREPEAQDSVEIADDVIADLDQRGEPVGLTLLNFKARLMDKQNPRAHTS